MADEEREQEKEKNQPPTPENELNADVNENEIIEDENIAKPIKVVQSDSLGRGEIITEKLSNPMEEKLDEMEEKLDKMEEKIGHMEEKLEEMSSEQKQYISEMNEQEEIEKLSHKLHEIQDEIGEIESVFKQQDENIQERPTLQALPEQEDSDGDFEMDTLSEQGSHERDSILYAAIWSIFCTLFTISMFICAVSFQLKQKAKSKVKPKLLDKACFPLLCMKLINFQEKIFKTVKSVFVGN